MSMVEQETSPWIIRTLLLSAGFFLGHAVGVVQATAFNTITQASMGQASTLFNVQNRMGSALGVAVLASLLAAFSPHASDASAAGTSGSPSLTASLYFVPPGSC